MKKRHNKGSRGAAILLAATFIVTSVTSINIPSDRKVKADKDTTAVIADNAMKDTGISGAKITGE